MYAGLMAQVAAGTKTLTAIRVLVVDDDPDTLDAVCFFLELQGATVFCAPDVKAAIGACGTFSPDVIVSDLMMPGEDGFAFLTQLRAMSPPLGLTPAVALSALSQGEARERALRVGFQSYLTKPVEPPRLLETVARLAQPS
jgi:CheY-like chemotaxis protein